ncbi:MAG: DUF7487 domain-containing protein [bacterium]
MVKCEICNEEFKNNLGGDLTKHLEKTHSMSMADYYVLTKLNGVEPKCQCGYCDERPNFRRGKFSKYSIGHEKHEWMEKKYVELHGKPRCQNPECNNEIGFHRGIPRTYCSFTCLPSRWNQEKVKQTVMEKYDVENVFQLDDVKEKSKSTIIKKFGVTHQMKSKKVLDARREHSLEKYGVDSPMKLDSVKEKLKNSMLKNHGVDNYSKTQKFREIASKNMCRYNDDLVGNHKLQKYKDTDLYYQSKYEFRFLEGCEARGILHKLTNSPKFKLSNGKWHIPDFIYNNTHVVEIKSTYWLNRQGGMDVIKMKKDSVEAMGYEYIFILDEKNDYFFENVCK